MESSQVDSSHDEELDDDGASHVSVSEATERELLLLPDDKQEDQQNNQSDTEMVAAETHQQSESDP